MAEGRIPVFKDAVDTMKCNLFAICLNKRLPLMT